jgi:AcrR family transcriptional regulator
MILAAAREAFAAKGFAGASLRSIATEAGVDTALIHHYFATKQQLFLEAMQVPVALPDVVSELVAGGLDGLGGRIARTLLGIWESDARPALTAALRTVLTEPGLARGMREFLTLEVIGRLLETMQVPPAEANRRAGLVAAHVLGLFTGRYLLELPALTGQTPQQLAAAVGPVLQRYLEGDFERPADETPTQG